MFKGNVVCFKQINEIIAEHGYVLAMAIITLESLYHKGKCLYHVISPWLFYLMFGKNSFVLIANIFINRKIQL